MKKVMLIAGAVILVVVAGYFVFQIDTVRTSLGLDARHATYNSFGIRFDYPPGPEGYVVQESTPADIRVGLVRVLTLVQTEDTLREMPIGGEGPPVIAISIFRNTAKQWPQTWADANPQYSNINLKTGEVLETVVGGANAIRYMADGLYASENVVVAHGDNVYVITGQFMDENSDIRGDFQPLLESVQFIPKPNQE